MKNKFPEGFQGNFRRIMAPISGPVQRYGIVGKIYPGIVVRHRGTLFLKIPSHNYAGFVRASLSKFQYVGWEEI